ncbi:MAG: hypothetical protein ACQR30_12260 [Arachidicoccus sp.]
MYPNGKILYAKPDGEIPTITYYKPQHKKNDIAVIVCLGGAYAFRSDNTEGIPICKMLNEGELQLFFWITAFPINLRWNREKLFL